MLKRFQLTEAEGRMVRSIVERIGCRLENLEENNFVQNAALIAQQFPLRIREAFYEFKLQESSCGLLVTNNPVLPQDVPASPLTHWHRGETRLLNLPQLIHGLYASLLGEPCGFETQQEGRIFNDLISIPNSRSNASSGAGKIGLHTEDCSQPFMPDYLGLMCLRNEQQAATTFSSLENICIPESVMGALFEDFFPLRSPGQQPVLFGDPQRPYLRYGPIDHGGEQNTRVATAMSFISDALERNRQTVTLHQGDCMYLDNFVAVHGRAPFQVEYGPNGRWFSRLIMLRDLRRARSFRSSPESRVMLKSRY